MTGAGIMDPTHAPDSRADAPEASLGAERDRWAACLGSAIAWIAPDGGRVDLQVLDVSPLRASSGQESFTLELHGPAAAPLGQGTHLLDGEAFGRVELFLVPVALDGDQLRYEAIFNRLVGPSAGPSSQDPGRDA